MEIAALIITSVISSIAMVLSAISLYVSKRQATASVITDNRIDWTNGIRTHLIEFLEEYINQTDKTKLKIKKSKLEMYIRNDAEVFKDLICKVNICFDKPYNDNDYNNLVMEAQNVLYNIWKKTKREAGLKVGEEKRLQAELESEFRSRGKKGKA